MNALRGCGAFIALGLAAVVLLITASGWALQSLESRGPQVDQMNSGLAIAGVLALIAVFAFFWRR